MKENSMLKSIMLVGIGIALGSGINAVSSSTDADKTKSSAGMPPPPAGPYRSIQPGGAVAPHTKAPLYPPAAMAAPPWQQAPGQMNQAARQHPAWARRPEQRPQRPDWAQRPQRPDWAKRPERPQRPEWAKRPQRPDWAKRPQRPQRPEWASRPAPNRWAPPMQYGYGYPPVPAYIAPWGYGPGAGWGQARR